MGDEEIREDVTLAGADVEVPAEIEERLKQEPGEDDHELED